MSLQLARQFAQLFGSIDMKRASEIAVNKRHQTLVAFVQEVPDCFKIWVASQSKSITQPRQQTRKVYIAASRSCFICNAQEGFPKRSGLIQASLD